MHRITKEQQRALLKVYDRTRDLGDRTYLQLRRTAQYDRLLDCILVPYAGMLLGIEPDGYTHS